MKTIDLAAALDAADATLQSVGAETALKLLKGPTPRTGRELLTLEEQAAAAGREVADRIVATHVLLAHEDAAFVERCIRTAQETSEVKLRRSGSREVEIRLSSGGTVVVETAYLEPDHSGKPGRRRGQGKRGPTGAGMYPVLVQLGIAERATPRVRFLSALQTVAADSYKAALSDLSEMGLSIDNRALVRYGQHTAQALIALRDSRLAEAVDTLDPSKLPLYGKTLQVSVDGGRVKLRFNQTRGRKRKNGRRGFTTDWKEPKGFIIQILDDKGRPDRKQLPFIDFIMGDCNELFPLLQRYLLALGAAHAHHLVFISDGADWIWNRLDGLKKALGLPDEKVTALLDFYHASEYLAKATNACTFLPESERRRVYQDLRGYLRHGQHGFLFGKLQELASRTDAEEVTSALNFLMNRKENLGYSRARHRHLPIGSGAIESAVRRVVNQRFKANGTLWSCDHIEPLLHLRALYACGRYHDAVKQLLDASSLFDPQTLISKQDSQSRAA